MTQNTSNLCLTPGSRVGRYEIREVLGMGGFGITYKALDTQLNRLVAIKEYLPAESAGRDSGNSQVQAHETRTDEYHYGLQRFLDEAKILAKFHHPNIIGVLDYLQANNTAYLIMTYEQGHTLSQHLKQMGGVLPELELKALFKPILTGLQHIHEHDYYHRDIKPGNIYIRQQGEPLLIDFGAARQAIGTRTRSITSVVSAGYAPSEQYGSNQAKQGPWSDLYAVGATLYRCISGLEPVDAPTRQTALFEQDPDPLTPAQTVGQGRYSPEFLSLIDWMLQPAIKNRPQNVLQVLARLESEPAETTAANTTTAPTRIHQEALTTAPTRLIQDAPEPEYIPASQRHPPQATRSQPFPVLRVALGIGAVSGLLGLAYMAYQFSQDSTQETTPPAIAQVTPMQTKPQKPAVIAQPKPTPITPPAQTLTEPPQPDPQLIEQQRREQQEQQRLAALQREQQAIQTLLNQAADDVVKLRLTNPEGNNAVDKYRQVLQRQVDNEAALQGLKQITEQYLQWAQQAIKQNQFDKAAEYVNKARTVQAEHPKIAEQEAELLTTQETYLKEQQRLAEIEKQKQAELEQQRQAQASPHGIKMVNVPAGCFQMGSNNGDSDEKPVHRVCLSAFQIGQTEVTQGQWRAVMGNNPSFFSNCGVDCPVEEVSWDDAQTFIRKLNQQTGSRYRLPTEAEWEYACRSGGKNQTYCGGDNVNSLAWYEGNSNNKTHPVKQKQPNGLGLYDMSGNVWEWVQDWFDRSYYNNSPENNPSGPSGGSLRVLRGGSWYIRARDVRSAFRGRLSPGIRFNYLGFRLARTR